MIKFFVVIATICLVTDVGEIFSRRGVLQPRFLRGDLSWWS
jgi:hypothetical protein